MFPFEQKIKDEFGILLNFAAEIEFYIAPGFYDKAQDNQLLAEILFHLSEASIAVKSIGFEVAPNQFEVALQPKSSVTAIEQYNKLKEIASDISEQFGQKALFEAKPFENLPGSGLHIHISLTDLQGKSLLKRIDDNKEQESEFMLHAVGGLCDTMLKNFIYFAPNENSYKRFSAKRNKLAEDIENQLSTHNNAPVNVSWGGNNRTTAIRIPTSTLHEDSRHIEFRVTGADADISIAIEKIIDGIYFGLKNKVTPPEKIYGNAYDEQYKFLKPLPKSLEEAKKLTLY